MPAQPGGGWDQTARAMQTALQEDGLATRHPGRQRRRRRRHDRPRPVRRPARSASGDAVMVGGLVMLGAILTNKSAVTRSTTSTPLARLTGEYEVLVVPADSPIKNMGDLVAKLKADPGSVSWGGGSAGGTDHIVAGLIAKAAGVDPTKVNYIAHAGGGEALSSILGGHVTVGVSGYQEFAQPDRGRQAPRHRHHRRRAGRRASTGADAQGAGRRRQAGQLARHLRAARHPRRRPGGAVGGRREDGASRRSGRRRWRSAAGSTCTCRPRSSRPSSRRTARRSRARSSPSASSTRHHGRRGRRTPRRAFRRPHRGGRAADQRRLGAHRACRPGLRTEARPPRPSHPR